MGSWSPVTVIFAVGVLMAILEAEEMCNEILDEAGFFYDFLVKI